MARDPKITRWRGPQLPWQPKDRRSLRGSRQPDASSRPRIEVRRAPPSAKRDGRRILRRWDRTGEVRALHRAAASGQAPTAARAVRPQRHQASVQRAWCARGQRHAVRGGEGGSAPELAGRDVIRAAQPSAEAGPPAREEVLDGIAHLRECVGVYKCQSGSAHGRVGGGRGSRLKKLTSGLVEAGRRVEPSPVVEWAQGESNPRPPVKTGGPGSSQWTLIR